MSIAKHLEYFANPANHFENVREAKNGAYFFVDLKVPTKVSEKNDGSLLTSYESAHNITYGEEFAHFIQGDSADDDQLYVLLMNNGAAGNEVDKYVNALEAKWRVSKNEADAILLMDYYIVVDKFKDAIRISSESQVKHDLLSVYAWADDNQVTPVAAISIWGALCSSPISRAVARAHLCHITNTEVFQTQIAGHAEFINLQDAFVLASVLLGSHHPVTVNLHAKWANSSPILPISVKTVSSQNVTDEDIKKLTTENDLVTSYRKVVCLLTKHKGLNFNAADTRTLRQTFIEALVARNWKLANALCEDIAARCNSPEFVKDTLVMVATMGEIIAASKQATETALETIVTELIKTGASFKKVVECSPLKDTIFSKQFTSDIDDEVEHVAGSIEPCLRGIRQAMKKMTVSDSEQNDLNAIFDMSNVFFKLLIDLDSEIECLKPMMPQERSLIDFLAKDGGAHFQNKIQNQRMSKLLNLLDKEMHIESSKPEFHQQEAKCCEVKPIVVNATTALGNQMVSPSNSTSVATSPHPSSHISSEEVVGVAPNNTTEVVSAPEVRQQELSLEDDEDEAFEAAFEKKVLAANSAEFPKQMIAQDHKVNQVEPGRELPISPGFKQPNPFGPTVEATSLPTAVNINAKADSSESLSPTGWEATQPASEVTKKIPPPLQLPTPSEQNDFDSNSTPLTPMTPKTPKILAGGDLDEWGAASQGAFKGFGQHQQSTGGGFGGGYGGGDAGRGGGYRGGRGGGFDSGNRGNYDGNRGGRGTRGDFRGRGNGSFDGGRGRGGGFSGGSQSSFGRGGYH